MLVAAATSAVAPNDDTSPPMATADTPALIAADTATKASARKASAGSFKLAAQARSTKLDDATGPGETSRKVVPRKQSAPADAAQPVCCSACHL